jgi:hypothetical protein
MEPRVRESQSEVWGMTTCSATSSLCERSNAAAPMASAVLVSSATTNAGAGDGSMPANMSVNILAIVTAELANAVDEVKKTAPAM